MTLCTRSYACGYNDLRVRGIEADGEGNCGSKRSECEDGDCHHRKNSTPRSFSKVAEAGHMDTSSAPSVARAHSANGAGSSCKTGCARDVSGSATRRSTDGRAGNALVEIAMRVRSQQRVLEHKGAPNAATQDCGARPRDD